MASSRAGWRVLLRARLCRIIVLSVVVLHVAGISSEALELSVEIKSGAVVPYGPIRLRDMATIACDSPEILAGSATAIVRPSGQVVTPKDVIDSLAQAGIGGVTLRLMMADEVSFRRENDIERWIGNASGWNGILEVQMDEVPPGAKLVPPDSLYPGVQAINLKFDVGGVEQIYPARLHWLLPAIVTDRYLRRGACIVASDLAFAVVEARRNRRYYDDPIKLIGMAVDRDMARGDPFTVRITEEPELVRSGERVRIIYRHGSLQVVASGRAMDGGALGDRIKVRNDRTRKVVLGIVAAPGIVEVNE